MGYWAKDGSYVRDASDDAPRMTQGDAWEAEQRVLEGMKDWEAQENRRKAAEKESRVEYHEIRKNIENQRMNAIKYERNQMEAIRIIVEQKRQEYNKKSWFNHVLCKDECVMPTVIPGHNCMWRFTEKTHCSNQDYINASTFPQDYDFEKINISYICGMSVPPLMLKRVVTRLIESGIFKTEVN